MELDENRTDVSNDSTSDLWSDLNKAELDGKCHRISISVPPHFSGHIRTINQQTKPKTNESMS